VTLRLDHIGIAVWDLRPAVRLWSELLGGRYMQGAVDYAGFSFLQLEYAGGSRVELLTPASDREGFLVRFLRRRGEGVHHVTFVSDNLQAEVARLRGLGVRILDEDYSNPRWREAFLSAELGASRLLIQVGESDVSTEQQDRVFGAGPLDSVLRAAERFAR
jgi:catechol 2,3-dioxygenase-like lactoylglutathione lyase family enzyme